MNPITMQPVESSQISSVGYDSAEHILAVQFTRGGLYHYHDVPQEKFDAMLKAESVGKYHGEHIKLAHRFEKMPPPDLGGDAA